MQVGDRIKVTARWHYLGGNTGVIKGLATKADGRLPISYNITLDDGRECVLEQALFGKEYTWKKQSKI